MTYNEMNDTAPDVTLLTFKCVNPEIDDCFT